MVRTKRDCCRSSGSKTQGKTIFVDDIISHHESVADLAPEVYRLHYVIHPKLRKLLGKVEAASDQAESWFELEKLHSEPCF